MEQVEVFAEFYVNVLFFLMTCNNRMIRAMSHFGELLHQWWNDIFSQNQQKKISLSFRLNKLYNRLYKWMYLCNSNHQSKKWINKSSLESIQKQSAVLVYYIIRIKLLCIDFYPEQKERERERASKKTVDRCTLQ